MNDRSDHHPKKSGARKLVTTGREWDVEVDVYLHSETPGDFTVESYLQSSSSNSQDLVFFNRGHNGFDVTFYLIDETGLGYRFPDPPNDKDAIWSQLMGVCPIPPCWDVFPQHRIQVKDAGTTLVAYNPNPEVAGGGGQGKFTYCLNVTKDGKKPYLPLDPGGVNQNGSTSQSRQQ